MPAIMVGEGGAVGDILTAGHGISPAQRLNGMVNDRQTDRPCRLSKDSLLSKTDQTEVEVVVPRRRVPNSKQPTRPYVTECGF